MASKELKFTKGYDQAELDAWWKMVGYPGEAPRIPDYLLGKTIGRGRDYMSVYDVSSGKLDKKSRQSYKDLDKTYGEGTAKAVNDFRNQLGKFSDPFREQSGISKVAGGVLGVASLAFPQLAAMGALADAGNKALKNPQEELEEALQQNAENNGAGSINDGTDVLPTATFDREQAPGPLNYLRYGMGPEHSFFRSKTSAAAPPPAVGVAPPTSIPQPQGSGSGGGSLLNTIRGRYMRGREVGDPVMADGGSLSRHYPPRPKGRPSQHLLNFASLPGMRADPRIRVAVGDEAPLSQFVSKGTGAGGRDDNIDAKLSENEYVIDAETVALLGDGSPEKGAQKLDEMRKRIRQHKGKALANGEISPNAKEGALQYLAEGGKVGALNKLLKKVKSTAAKRRMMDLSWGEAHDTVTNREVGDWKATDLARERIKKAHSVKGATDHPTLVYADGGKVGALRVLFKRKPKPDPNASLRRVNAILESALNRERPSVNPPPGVSFEDYAREILRKSDQDILEGK